jgi:ABC-type Fe3+ transport system substrate-binding protein
VADAAILQTTQDFDRWKQQGDLLKYKPIGWNDVYANAKDKDGYWTGAFYAAFSYVVNAKQLPADPSAFSGTDLLQPAYKGKLIFTYPNDDDAVLFSFKQIIDKYGWKWLRDVMAQDPAFVRGVPNATGGVANGTYLATAGAAGDARPNGVQVLPAGERFASWAQRGAIFNDAKHKAAAKLFMSWLTSKSAQTNLFASWTWSVRRDVAPPTGLKPLSAYTNTNPDVFARFMSDRAAVKRLRSQVERYVGRVQGADPADPDNTLGRTPGGF